MQLVNVIFWLTISAGTIWVITVLALAIGLRRVRFSRNGSPANVSVLIAARNEENNIEKCLSALSNQDYPLELYEIILIDDNSSDRTKEIASSCAEDARNIRVIDAGQAPPGIAPKKNALLRGIEASTGEMILTTDADCEPPPGWISVIISYFEPGIDAVAGYSPIIGEGFAGSLSSFDSFVNAVLSAGTLGLGFPSSAVGRNFAYRRSAWNRVGGFGSSATGASGDDDLLLQRIATGGGKVAFALAPDSFVAATGKDNLADWLRMKRRHFSAGKRYQPGLIFLFTMLYLFNPALICATVLGILGCLDAQLVAAIWGAKISIDGLALSRGARIFEQKKWGLPWLIAELISPFLFSILVPSALFGQIRWKDRSLKS